MQKRRLRNLPAVRQRELARQFPWLKALVEDERPKGVQILSVTVFDHWLSRDEACALLENVSSQEQQRRDELLANFCGLLIAATSVLSFTFRGRTDDRLLFREFASQDALFKYCTPGGGRTLKHRHFSVVLPELNCVFMEGWDATYHFFFTEPTAVDSVTQWAQKSGVYALAHV